jgi:Zn-dependent protease with chaperone function
VVDNGAEKLSTGLISIVEESRRSTTRTRREKPQNSNAYKALFISDPDRAAVDSSQLHAMQAASKESLLKETLAKEPTSGEKLLEIFSTHPNIIKRLRALQTLS